MLVDFLRVVRMADEDDVEPLVAPLQEQMQQHEEALGQILLALAHRARHVHQAEHHRLARRHRLLLEGVEAHIDRIEERHPFAPVFEPRDFFFELGDRLALVGVGRRAAAQRDHALAQRLDLFFLRAGASPAAARTNCASCAPD